MTTDKQQGDNPMETEVTFQCDICHKYVRGVPVYEKAGMVIGTLEVCKDCARPPVKDDKAAKL